MTMNNGASPVQVTRSAGGRLTVVLDSDFEPQDVLAALSEASDEARTANPESFAPDPVRTSSRPYPGEFLG